MTRSVCQIGLPSLRNDSKDVGHPVPALYEQDTKTLARKRVTGLARRNEGSNAESADLVRSFATQIQIWSHKMATSSKINALDAYPTHAVRLNFAQIEKRNIADHWHTLFEFLRVVTAELREIDREHSLHERLSMHECTFSRVVHLEDAIAQKCWPGAREDRIMVLCRTILFSLSRSKMLRRVGLKLT